MKPQKIDLLEQIANKEFCVLPFTSLQVGTTFLSPCCKTTVSPCSGNNKEQDFLRFLNDKRLHHIRNEFLEGRTPSQCSHCFLPSEENFLYPAEKGKEIAILVDRFGINTEIDVADPDFLTLNFTLSSTCNLACRMCAPSSSSTLNKIWDQSIVNITGMPKIVSEDLMHADAATERFLMFLIDHKKFDRLTSVTLSGGEPLMHKNLIEWVKKLYDRGVKRVTIVTNASCDPFNFYDAYSKIDNSMNKGSTISIDGSPIVHNYVRAGIDMESFEATVKNIASKDNLSLCATFTPSAFNMHDAVGALKYIHQLFGKNALVRISVVENGYCSFNVLPRPLKIEILNKIKRELPEVNPDDFRNPETVRLFIKTVIDYIENSIKNTGDDSYSNAFMDFIKFTKRLDEIHGTDIRTAFPLLIPYLD